MTDNHIYSKINNIQPWISAILMFLCANPYVLWHTPLVSVALALLCVVCVNQYTMKGDAYLFGVLFLAAYVYYLVGSGRSIFGCLSVLLIVPFFFLKGYYIEKFYNTFLIVFSFFLIPSIIQYVLCTFIGISFGYNIILPYEEGKVEMYRQYLFFVETDQIRLLPRFFAYFDEPGVVGTICGMILLSQKFDMSKWYNIVILLSGILSVSVAFFFFVFAGMALCSYKFKWIIVIGIMFVVYGLSQIDYLEPLFMRFSVEDNQLAGDNRTTEYFDSWFSNFIQSSDVWLGKGRDFSATINEGGSSYKNIIVDYGILFFVFYILIFCTKAIRRIGLSRELLIWLVLFFGCMYQRPSLNRPEYVFVWLSSIYILSNNKSKLKVFR